MAQLKFSFSRGGSFVADVLEDSAPATCLALRAALPLTRRTSHARWSGRETYVGLQLGGEVPRENQVHLVGPGDVVYGREWSDRDVTGFETLGWLYGPEALRDWRGENRANLLARVSQDQWGFLQQLGARVWSEGGEDCTIEWLED